MIQQENRFIYGCNVPKMLYIWLHHNHFLFNVRRALVYSSAWTVLSSLRHPIKYMWKCRLTILLMKLMACVLNDLCILCVCVCLVSQLCPTLCDSMDCRPPGSSVPGDVPGKNTGVGCHGLLQGIFPIQGSNTGLSHCSQILYCLSHQGILYSFLKQLMNQ